MKSHDVVIIGAGAAGLMCAIEAGKRGRSVCLIDHAGAIGEKIRISGGGRCNFTNIHCSPKNFISQNPHFCISALKSYTQHDFIAMVERYGIAYHEKALGQLFCDGKSNEIIDMLKKECDRAGVIIKLNTSVDEVSKDESFSMETSNGSMRCNSLVIATGGKSIPKMGATGFGYDIARHFGLDIVETRPGLVPFTFSPDLLDELKELAGVSVNAVVRCGKVRFEEALLFTHRGISGPVILQISSFWREGDEIELDLAPGFGTGDRLKLARRDHPKQEAQTRFTDILPKRLAVYLCQKAGVEGRLGDLSNEKIQALDTMVHRWKVKPGGTEGYRTAEVTLGGVDTKGLSSKTFEAASVPGLYFIGEVLDVTGHLGGFNFQWAWSSGYAAGQYV